MAWEQVSTTAIDIKKTVNQPYVGHYTGSKDIETKIGKQVIWQFNDEDGNYLGIYGFTNLNRAMENIKVGSLLRITYTGTQNVKTKFGLKDVHQVKVEIDTADSESGTKEPF